MALTKITKTGITDAAVEKAKVGADAIDATKIEDDAISEEHLDVTAITGHTELDAVADDTDVLLVFDTSASAIKKIKRSNISLQAPSVTSISPTNALTGDGTGNFTIVITGTKFDATATASFINSSGTTINPTSSTRNSATQITAVVAKSSLPDSGEPYDIKVSNGNGLNATLDNALNINAQPVYTTAAGSVGTVTGGSAITPIDIVATDPESAGAVTFEFQSGALPAGLSSATVNENGVSKFRISGTPTNPASNTTTNFVLRAVDAASNTTSRAFSILVNRNYSRTSFTSSGTFAVPSGISIVNVLVVAGGGGGGHPWGGGGGAGGLIYMPEAPVTPGGTVAITVGCGGSSTTNDPGSAAPSGSDSVFGASPSPGTPAALTAKGGGGGGKQNGNGNPGGSGGGAGRDNNSTNQSSATQPTQSGNSGAYGFGNQGGATTASPYTAGAGGGGAGAAGGQSTTSGTPTNGDGGLAGDGGVGKAYTIADGTTSVFYAGGGGGSRIYNAGPLGGGSPTTGGGLGGQGGGGRGAIVTQPNTTVRCTGAGSANKGGGGGGGACVPSFAPGVRGYSGGKGIVIVEY
tara:strand:- start:7530 stop:9266 length:1737 start_codon:yes stop_codon:yes gene_type:complete